MVYNLVKQETFIIREREIIKEKMGFIDNNKKKQVKDISGVLVYTLRE